MKEYNKMHWRQHAESAAPIVNNNYDRIKLIALFAFIGMIVILDMTLQIHSW